MRATRWRTTSALEPEAGPALDSEPRRSSVSATTSGSITRTLILDRTLIDGSGRRSGGLVCVTYRNRYHGNMSNGPSTASGRDGRSERWRAHREARRKELIAVVIAGGAGHGAGGGSADSRRA